MALIACYECTAEVSSEAKACPQCGAAPKKPKKTKWWLWAPLGLIVAFLGFGAIVGSSPEAKMRAQDRATIDYCWEDQKRKSYDPNTAAFVARSCELLEERFRAKHGLNP